MGGTLQVTSHQDPPAVVRVCALTLGAGIGGSRGWGVGALWLLLLQIRAGDARLGVPGVLALLVPGL